MAVYSTMMRYKIYVLLTDCTMLLMMLLLGGDWTTGVYGSQATTEGYWVAVQQNCDLSLHVYNFLLVMYLSETSCQRRIKIN